MQRGTMDFETASEAGFAWNEEIQKWRMLPGARDYGLFAVGAAAYSEHPTTRVLCLRFKLPGDATTEHWRPGLPLPQRLFNHLAAGGLAEAHNVMFEYLIWENVCVPKYGFPSLKPWVHQLRCSMAKARVNALPGPLAQLSIVLGVTLKDTDGKRLLDKFSRPRNPTKKDARLWIMPEDDWPDFVRLDAYCHTDVVSEEEASDAMPEMTDAEIFFWLIDQEINRRGVCTDRESVGHCIAILEQVLEKYGAEFQALTGGLNPTQVAATGGWLHAQGIHLDDLQAETVEAALDYLPPHPPGGVWPPRRVLEIRALTGSASVKKLYAMDRQACRDGRLRDLIMHHGARTGRPTGEGPQPLNLPRSGPPVRRCVACATPYDPRHANACPWCAAVVPEAPPVGEWGPDCVEPALAIIATRRLDLVEWFFGDAAAVLSGCIRGLFVAAPGHNLIASDYSAIEAVVTAMLAGCQWRIEAFRRGDPIYLLSASKITGTPLADYLAYHEAHGHHHPDRQKKGKVAELAGGFGGWVGAWFQFGYEGTEDEAKAEVLAWRAASPEIPEMWGGQYRRGDGWGEWTQEYFGFEGAAVLALLNPGTAYTTHGITFYYRADDALIIRLLSGREMTYWYPRLAPSTREWEPSWTRKIIYMSWNTNPKYGAMGWVPMVTYGGKLTENIVQATAHDILRHAIINLRAAGYPTVLHVYDEIVAEIPEGTGDLAVFEQIMSDMPAWCADWPVKASGGWIGKRYRK